MPSSTVRLGDITFRGHEVPEEIPFGGDQRLVKHKLVGGRRVVDAMGPDALDPKWRGRFRGPSALSRARAVDRLRESGAQVPLTWGGLFFMVVVERFHADYRRSTDIKYEIECCVIDDGASALGSAGGIDALVSGDLSSLAGIVDFLPDAAGAVLNGFADAVDAIGGGLDSLAEAALAPLQSLAAGALDVLDGALDAADAALGAFDGLDPAALAGPELAAALVAQGEAATEAAATASARAYAGRIDANLSTISG